MKTAKFIGGPLDGQQAVKPGPGRWSIYRDDDGQPIRTSQGDREFCTFAGRPLSRFYIHRRYLTDFYVHATVIDSWLSQPVTASALQGATE